MEATSAFHDSRRRAPITLWVEDRLTQMILEDLWQDPRISIETASGKHGVRYMMNATPREDRSWVLGLVDRDFDEDNYERWDTLQDGACFCLPAHEVENLLLDFPVLSELAGEPAAALENTARQAAEELLWWVVTKRLFWDLNRAINKDRPVHVPQTFGATSASAVVEYLEKTNYIENTAATLDDWTRERLLARVEQCAAEYRGALDSNAWKTCFPGKELIRRLRNRHRRLDSSGGTRDERDQELCRRVVRIMMKQNVVPEALSRLGEIIRRRLPASSGA
jgi:hypothetical protein